MKRAAAAVACLLVWTLLPMGAAHAEAGHDDENELLQLVNSDRAANGLPPVQMDGRLQADSRAWSAHLAHVAFEHDPNQPWYDCTLRSENVAFGQRTIAEVHSAFMASPGHRANILRAGITIAGFGVYYDASGVMYTAERFYTCPSVVAPATATGAIRSAWMALGATPTYGRYQGSAQPACWGGSYQPFGGGSDTGVQASTFYAHPSVDGGRAHVTYGVIRDAWGAWGYECGALHYPTTDPFSIGYCRAAVNPSAQAFEFGVIEFSGATGAHVLVPGNIYAKFAATKGHCGPAGLPTSDVFDWPGAETTWRAQTFEYRYIAEYKPTGKTYICTYQGSCS